MLPPTLIFHHYFAHARRMLGVIFSRNYTEECISSDSVKDCWFCLVWLDDGSLCRKRVKALFSLACFQFALSASLFAATSPVMNMPQSKRYVNRRCDTESECFSRDVQYKNCFITSRGFCLRMPERFRNKVHLTVLWLTKPSISGDYAIYGNNINSKCMLLYSPRDCVRLFCRKRYYTPHLSRTV